MSSGAPGLCADGVRGATIRTVTRPTGYGTAMGPQGTRIAPRLVILLSQDKIGAMNPTTLSRIGTPTTVVSNVVAWVLTGDASRLYWMDASSNTIAGVSKAPASATPFTLPVALTSDPMLA